MERVSGRHRRNFNLKGASVVGGAMAIVVVIAGTWLGYQQLADSGCTGSIKLSVAAAPEIAPAVSETAEAWSKSGANVNGTCVTVAVSEQNPADVAGAISREHGVSLSGLGTAPETVQVPDVWLPDSSTWLLRLQNEASGFTPSKITSVAQSPLVIAMPEPVAKQAGWEGKALALTTLLKQFGSADAPNFGIVNPARDASGLTALMAIASAAGEGEEALKSRVQALTVLAENSSALREELLQKFPRSTDEGDIAEALGAAPLSEEDVIEYNAQRPQVQLSALYLDPSPVPLDYPYSVLPQVVDGEKLSAAQGLLAQLTSASFKNEIANAGLRSPDGTYGSGFSAPLGAPKASPAISESTENTGGTAAAAGLTADSVSQVVGSWNAATQPGRVLAVFDVSGSMKTKVPTAGNLTRAVVTQRAAAAGLAMFSNQWAVGVWKFSTDMDGSKPYVELRKITPLSTGRDYVSSSIAELTPKDEGNTGLYDTVLAAYRSAKANWKAGKVNSVILFTDGQNDNPDGLKQDELLAALKKEQDPKKFVRLVLIGIGDDVDKNELGAISKAVTGSGVFIAEDPAKMGDIFLQAIGSRTGVS
ncbi:substrate-binding and VWA domain-containing protein [Actinoplanes sp. NPDC051851]|uniref:substrate-binding and VWA domain-containing protein n=1 Tax=Actinoplanes sp. NPDC051851 TaxID=3154753 RepID=UPI003413DE8E